MAFGVNISVARLGSVIQAKTVPPLYDSGGLSLAMLIGLIICVFSLINAFGMVVLERMDKRIMKKAQPAVEEKKEAKTAEKKEAEKEEAFQISDLKTFRLPFWLLTISCVATYMSIFPYIQIVSDLIQKKYKLDSDQAGTLFGIPYLISAVLSPVLGFGIDKVGKRALFVTLSSAVLIVAFVISASLPSDPGSHLEAIPLVLVGCAYSVYCSAIWGSIPYAVEPRTVGTAYGICTAVQNIGLVVAPTLVGLIKENTKDNMYGYFWVLIFFIGVNVVGFVCNFYLYYIDIKYYDGILNKVDSGEDLAALAASPTQERKSLIRESQIKKSVARQSLIGYQLSESARTDLKKSLAKVRT